MSTKSTDTFVEEGGVKKEALQVTFTNGSLQQLKELAAFFKAGSASEMVEKAIGIMQKVKEMDDLEAKKVPTK